MEKFFISYAHSDLAFVSDFIHDLKQLDVPVTYDMWELKIGDSIINKISSVIDESFGVIVVISHNSVTSNWVSKELSLALMGEINDGKKVIPVKIDDSKLPASLKDKLYADLSFNYYRGFRRLLETIIPEKISMFERGTELRKIEDDKKMYLSSLIINNEEKLIIEWIKTYPENLYYEFGSRWSVSEILNGISFKNIDVNFFAINGQSFRYNLKLIILGKLSVLDQKDYLYDMQQKIEALQEEFLERENDMKRVIAIRMRSSYGVSQILNARSYESIFSRIPKIALVAGRRAEYNKELNKIRNKIFEKSHETIEIVSYNRIVDSINKDLSPRY